MSKSLYQLHGLIQACSLVGCVLLPAKTVIAKTLSLSGELRPAVAAVTSHQGNIRHHDLDGNRRAVHARSILPIDQTFFGTKKNGSLFLSLSNGIGLGLGESTHLWLDQYKQSTINPQHESLNFEGSVSHLNARIEVGTLAVAFDHLIPLSKAEFNLPLGQLQVHSGKALIVVQPDSTCQISMYEGTATFYDNETNKREFISAGKSLTFTPESKKQSARLSSDPLDLTSENWPRLLAAADYSRLRVLFRHNPDGGQPLHEWVLPNELFERPSSRPYQFELK